jgi:flagellin-like protein
MKLRHLFTDENAVSSTIGVVLMVAVTVILAAAVGAFALDLASESSEKVPSASIETEWSHNTQNGNEYDLVAITMQGGDALESKFVSVSVAGTVAWEDGNAPNTPSIEENWGDPIQSGDTLQLNESAPGAWGEGNTLRVVWNNGEKSQVLGTGSVH